jgi:hypothetical protein
VFATAAEEFLVSYVDADPREVAAYRAAYHAQRQGKELRGYDNSVAGKNRQAGSPERRWVALPDGSIEVTEQVLDDWSDRDLLVWWLYVVDGRPDRMGLKGQLAYGLKSLWHPPTASVVALAAECRPDCSAARASLEAIAPAALPALLGRPSPPEKSAN